MFFLVPALGALVTVFFTALAFMDQRALRRRLAARQGRDPAVNEPSAAGYAAGRVTWLVLAGLFAFGTFVTWDSAEFLSLGEDEAREVVDDAARSLEGDPLLLSPTYGSFKPYVDDAVRDAADGSGALPSVSLDGEGAGKGGGVERYDVSLGDGEYHYCLVVTSTVSEDGGMTVPGAVQGQESTTFPEYDLATEVGKGSC